MVWKQDLAKLKHQLKEEGEPPRPSPIPKPAPPGPPKSMGEEDAMFLAAMGKRPSVSADFPMPARNVVKPEVAPPVTDMDFQTALGDLQGLKALARNPVFSASAPPPKLPPHGERPQPPLTPEPEVLAVLAPVPDPPSPPSISVPAHSSPIPPAPRLIHLAAGMAVDVDGVLDLSGHTVNDAHERLKERLQDAGVLGWRTLHVILGPSESLREAFLAFLLTPQARALAQYAQAPIPMGGSQAFIIYFAGPTA